MNISGPCLSWKRVPRERASRRPFGDVFGILSGIRAVTAIDGNLQPPRRRRLKVAAVAWSGFGTPPCVSHPRSLRAPRRGS